MNKLIDISGRKFNMLTVVCRDPNGTSGYSKWICRCDCGNSGSFLSVPLRNGSIFSCGCTRRKYRSKKGGYSVNPDTKLEYSIWHQMKARCLNKKNISFKNYGGREIKVCDRWLNSFKNFLSDMGRCPQGFSIERIEINGDYEPSNCKWIPKLYQRKNTRRNRFIEYDSKKMILADWARSLGMTPESFRAHLDRYGSVGGVIEVIKRKRKFIFAPINEIVITNQLKELLDTGTKIQTGDGEWYHFPFWIKKDAIGKFTMYGYHELPESIKEDIKKHNLSP